MGKYTNLKSRILMGAAVCVFPQVSAFAQTPTDQEVAATYFDEVIVTSQRREQNVQDIPVSVSAISGEALAQGQIVETIDLARAVPNLVTANNVQLGTSVTYFLRGTGSTESIATFDLPVGTYVDEVYISRQNANQMALSGVERVEVLRGPQGTLFGRNTTGGAVSIVTKKPNEEFSFDGEASYGSFDRRAFRGEVNLPLSEKVMTRFSAISVEDDGWIESATGENLNGESSWGGRLAVRALLSDTITWDGSAQFTNTEKTGIGVPGVVQDGPAGPFTVFPISTTGDLRRGLSTDTTCEPTGGVETWNEQGCTFNGVESTLLISNLGIETGLGDISFITGYSNIDQNFVIDNFANTDQPVLGGGFGSNYYLANSGNHNQFSQEIKLSGSTSGGRVDYVTGVFYLDEDNETDVVDTVGTFVFGDRFIENGTKSFAVYGQVDVHINDRTTLQLGGRYTDEEKDFAVEGDLIGTPTTSADVLAAGVPLELEVSKFTPRLAVQYEVSDDINIFASYTEGFKSGGWNARSFTPQGYQEFTEEEVTSYEAGIKADFFDNRARVNATLFRAEYSDLQVPGILPFSTDFITVNAADAIVNGLEIEASLYPVEGLRLFTNLGFMDGDYDNLTQAALDASLGPKMQRTPDVTAQVGFSSDFSLGAHDFTLNADGHYTSSFETGPANTLAGSVDAATLYNARLAWTPPTEAENLEFSIGCQNCSDETYVVQELLGQIYANAPRRVTAGVRLKY